MKHLKENNTKSTPGVGISLPQGYISVYPKGTHLPTLGVHICLPLGYALVYPKRALAITP